MFTGDVSTRPLSTSVMQKPEWPQVIYCVCLRFINKARLRLWSHRCSSRVKFAAAMVLALLCQVVCKTEIYLAVKTQALKLYLLMPSKQYPRIHSVEQRPPVTSHHSSSLPRSERWQRIRMRVRIHLQWQTRCQEQNLENKAEGFISEEYLKKTRSIYQYLYLKFSGICPKEAQSTTTIQVWAEI